MKETGAEQACKAFANGKLICELLLSEVIEKESHGWVVVDNIWSSALGLRKNED